MSSSALFLAPRDSEAPTPEEAEAAEEAGDAALFEAATASLDLADLCR